MTDIVDFISPASDGCYALLAGSAAIAAAGATIGTNFKEDVQPPLVVIDQIESEDQGIVGAQLEELTIQVVVVYQGQSRATLNALISLVREALTDQRPAAAGVEFGTLRFVKATSNGPGEDGKTHLGSIIHKVMAQPA